jgi:hypothetical protein
MRHILSKSVAIAGLAGALGLACSTPSQARWWSPGAVAAGIGPGLVGGLAVSNSYYGGPYDGYGYPGSNVYGYATYGYAPAYAAYGPTYGYWGGTRRPHNPKYDNY